MQELLQKHEQLKALWINVGVETVWEWQENKEKMELLAWELDSQYRENKVTIKKNKWIRSTMLKVEKKVSDKMVDNMISEEFYETDLKQEALVTQYKLLLTTADNAQEYINIIKLNIKTNTNI